MYTTQEVCAGAVTPIPTTLTGFPALIEARPLNRDSKVENGETRCFLRHLPAADRPLRLKIFRVESHDMYENAGTYAKNTRFSKNCISLIISRLASRLELIQGELKVKAKATML